MRESPPPHSQQPSQLLVQPRNQPQQSQLTRKGSLSSSQIHNHFPSVSTQQAGMLSKVLPHKCPAGVLPELTQERQNQGLPGQVVGCPSKLLQPPLSRHQPSKQLLPLSSPQEVAPLLLNSMGEGEPDLARQLPRQLLSSSQSRSPGISSQVGIP